MNRGFRESVERAEAQVESVATRLHRYVSTTYVKLRFGNIPEVILSATRRDVDAALASKCPEALEKFAAAYEELTKD
jgi:hypothetical protein